MIRIGVSPIAWQNDDLPDLTAAFTMDQALQDACAIGYSGVERGRRMPSDTGELATYLDRYGLALCGGWCSGNLLVRSVAAEIEAIRAQVEQFAALAAPCIVYAECSNTVQGGRTAPLTTRPKLTRDEIRTYAARLGDVARWTADQGVPLAYHHHMGSMIEDEDDVTWLMDATPREVTLLYDTGHLLFGGAAPLRVLDRFGDRVRHVHFKDVRPDIARMVRERDLSFLDAVIAGVFTVPGDGSIDFAAVTDALQRIGYAGWIVVEAEQDPAKAPPAEFARKGYDHIVALCARAGLVVEPVARLERTIP